MPRLSLPLLSQEVKARAVGRKRNAYGKALGDIVLQGGQTVEGVVRENMGAALRQAGYAVKNMDSAGPSPLIIDAHITKFWAWFQPGFWAIALNTNVATTLDLSGAMGAATISVHAKDSRQMATDDAWIQIVDKALEAYRQEVIAKAVNFP